MHLNLKGVRKKVKVCTGCMRTMRKHAGERSDIA
jgi:hypothetical protein